MHVDCPDRDSNPGSRSCIQARWPLDHTEKKKYQNLKTNNGGILCPSEWKLLTWPVQALEHEDVREAVVFATTIDSNKIAINCCSAISTAVPGPSKRAVEVVEAPHNGTNSTQRNPVRHNSFQSIPVLHSTSQCKLSLHNHYILTKVKCNRATKVNLTLAP